MFLQQIPFKHKTTWTGTPALLLSTLALSLSLLVSYSLYPLDSIFLIIFDYFQPLCYTHTATTPDTGTERG